MKHAPFDQDYQVSFIIPTVVEESFKYEFRTIFKLVAHLEEIFPFNQGLT